MTSGSERLGGGEPGAPGGRAGGGHAGGGRACVVGLGEVLWDRFPTGSRFGGAPANFACCAAGIGRGRVDVFMAGGVGRDELGDQAIAFLNRKSVDSSCMARQDRATGTVEVTLDSAGKPAYEIRDDVAWDYLGWSDRLAKLAVRADAVCFGTLGQRREPARATIRRFLTAMRPPAFRVLDVNLRPPFFNDEVIRASLEMANVLKLSDEELPELARVCGISGSTEELLDALVERFSLGAVALTRGAEGALLMRGGERSDLPGAKTPVVDTVGAGDAFAATFVLGLLDGAPLDVIHHRAQRVAGYVCSQKGATPDFPERLA